MKKYHENKNVIAIFSPNVGWRNKLLYSTLVIDNELKLKYQKNIFDRRVLSPFYCR
jgi:hypothetical protein